ncbi:zinc finger protein 391 [Tribolium castaneum]|uniref:Zinc finger protein 3-like Protein n=1 Tax=Tribolium castaneum TaxID=7070 RepID=D6WFQ5_TRICA|nr:PREDICTED: zinc finger protein 391 [Tribolium castaneum]EEZ99579.1 Zinc finger protein 3-like Protein [Tribolium castaneum]|eukprot:XP_008200068.1 PREDICTED: zinc finger protein 391 [Tribolium castaneum]
MDMKNNLALKKKRELLGGINKRKMTLRKYMDNLKQSECRLDITQITKCVFLGSLCLKPVPHLFDSPLLLEELDAKVGSVGTEFEYIEMKSVMSDKEAVTKDSVKRGLKKKTLNSPKIKKKTLKVKTDIRTTPNGYNSVKSESASELVEATTAMSPVLPVINTEETSPVLSSFQTEPSESMSTSEENQVETPFPDFLDIKLLNQNIKDIKGVNPDPFAFEEDEAERLRREPTPELILSDSDEDAIDQLMYNIMDIKVGPNVFDKDFFDMPPSDIEEDYEEYSNDSQENKNEPNTVITRGKKYSKRAPQCKICSQVFSTYMQLKKHKLAHDGDKPYFCLKCNENHQTLDQLIAHLRTHQGKRPYVCKKCNQGFKTLKGLESHHPVHVLKKVSSQKRVFRCEVCNKEFHKLCDLERHTRVHTGEKPSICNICNKRFQQAHNLNKHLLIHTQEKPYECDVCHKKFGRNDVLNRHLLTHSVKKPNRCEICMKSFIRVSQLLAHNKKHHTEMAS